MNSQNRMNAGGEYVLYRIWAALQDRKGIHPESLLACVGALAGYACQTYVRQTAALRGADAKKHALMAVENSDGTTYLYGDALNRPLAESPLSIWALVSRAVQKLGEPVPDIEDIIRHVTQTIGTSAFGAPRVPEGHRPRQAAIVYLKQIWPQILPIAQRFCRKPAQLPVLFGIALQRAIEQTQDMLSPTLGASIAMECAVAMSKVALPEAPAERAVTQPVVIATEMISAPTLIALPARDTRADSTRARATPAPKRRSTAGAEAKARNVGALIASVPPTTRIVTIASLAIMTVAGALYETDRREAPEPARAERAQQSLKLQASLRVIEPPPPEVQASQDEQFPEEASAPDPTPAEPAESVMNEENQRQLDSNSDGSSEMVPSAELLPSAE